MISKPESSIGTRAGRGSQSLRALRSLPAREINARLSGTRFRKSFAAWFGVPFIAVFIAGSPDCRAIEDGDLLRKRSAPDIQSPGNPSPTLTAIQTAATPDSAPGKSPEFSSPKELRSLIDQEGRPFSFERLADKTVLVNFIFTSCPVKCPTQTRALIGIQRALSPALRPRVRFVSLTVDPERDSVLVLRRYATAMGADLSGWSFVTGEESELNWLNRYYSVGVRAIDNGQFDHQMGAYLLDAQGRVMQRYTGDIDKPRLLREIAEIDALNR